MPEIKTQTNKHEVVSEHCRDIQFAPRFPKSAGAELYGVLRADRFELASKSMIPA
jgi:hypothetical protein